MVEIIIAIMIVIMVSIILFIFNWTLYVILPIRRIFGILYKFRDNPVKFNYKGQSFEIEYKIVTKEFSLFTYGQIIINGNLVANVVEIEHVFLKSRQIRYEFPEDEVLKLLKVGSKTYDHQLYKRIEQDLQRKTLFK